MAKTTKARNRAAQDATLINLRALKRQVKALTARVEAVEQQLAPKTEEEHPNLEGRSDASLEAAERSNEVD